VFSLCDVVYVLNITHICNYIIGNYLIWNYVLCDYVMKSIVYVLQVV